METKKRLELERLQASAQMEKDCIQRSIETKSNRSQHSHEARLQAIVFEAAVERMWFLSINQRRVEMVNEHIATTISDFEAGREPSGLSEVAAAKISPLPAPEAQGCRELPHQIPVELESPEQLSSTAMEGKMDQNSTHESLKPTVKRGVDELHSRRDRE